MNASIRSWPESLRISRNQALMDCAWTWQKRSTCLRLHVGAIVAREGRILVTGYNGAPSGIEHCNPENCGPDSPCTRAVHAEANCIAFAARHGISLQGTQLVTTDSPCVDCAKLIINAGIKDVLYWRPYRDISPLKLFAYGGVTVTKFDQ
jgi:dCMP deaminase